MTMPLNEPGEEHRVGGFGKSLTVGFLLLLLLFLNKVVKFTVSEKSNKYVL